MLTLLENIKLKKLRSIYGNLTIEKALDLSICSEETSRACGPFDPAFSYFSNEQRELENMAFLLEKEAIQ